MDMTARLTRFTLIQGAAYMLVGLAWGIFIPATPFPRLALVAHIQLTGTGVMFLVAGLVISHAALGRGTIARTILIAGPWLSWGVPLTEMANAWWGTHDMLPIAAQQAGALGAAKWQEGALSAAHVIGALALLIYWSTILGGLLSKRRMTAETT